MIKAVDLVKRFENFTALDKVNCEIPKGCIYGMVGSNGAGKSTFLRIMSGIYKNDGGEATIDGEPVFENQHIKSRIAFVPDELYFLPGANLKRMEKLYRSIYKGFDTERFNMLINTMQLPYLKNINTFSKGMKRQAATILALSAKPDYIFFDETFDGLDPIMRGFVKSLICNDVAERRATAIITSHSLRELEDTCDQLALLHKGGVVLESDIQNLKTTLFKIQIAFTEDYDINKFNGIDIVNFTKRGSVSNLIVRGDRDRTEQYLRSMNPVLFDMLPLTLEEVFTFEMEALGYDFRSVLEEISGEK